MTLSKHTLGTSLRPGTQPDREQGFAALEPRAAGTGQVLIVGAPLCLVGCCSASLACPLEMPQHPPTSWDKQNCLQTLLYVLWGGVGWGTPLYWLRTLL